MRQIQLRKMKTGAIMKTCVIAICMFTITSALAETGRRTITGRVFDDLNANGKFDSGETVYPGILITDGIHIVATDSKGCYRLAVHPGQKFVTMHKPANLKLSQFYQRITPQRSEYDFTVKPAEVKKTVQFLAVADSETSTFAWTKPIKEYIKNVKNIDFIIHLGDICDMSAHASNFNESLMGVPVYYCIGNHDMGGAENKGQNYADTLGPYWYSFEYGDTLFVVSPMYLCFSPPLPYKLEDFSGWLVKLLARFPKQKTKIIFSHDMLNHHEVAAGRIQDEIKLPGDFNAYIYGHKHMNVFEKWEGGMKSFTMAPPNKAGIGLFPPSYEVFNVSENGDIKANIRFTGMARKLNITCPASENMIGRDDKGRLQISVIAYDPSCPIDSVNAVLTFPDGKIAPEIVLSQFDELSWGAAIEFLPEMLNRRMKIDVTAKFADGTLLTNSREFTVTSVASQKAPNGKWCGFPGATKNVPAYLPDVKLKNLRLAWMKPLPIMTALAGPIVADSKVFVAVCDDSGGENGGIYALDAANGKELWFYRTGYSVRNTLNWYDGRIYAIDSRGNIHAVNADTGQRVWINESDETRINPSASGLVVGNNIVYGGYGVHFRACEAKTGKLLWRNRTWVDRTPGEDSLSMQNGLVFVISELNGLFAYDGQSGEIIYNFKPLFLSGTAIPSGNRIYVKGLDSVYALNIKTGKVLFERKWSGLKTASSPVIAGKKLFFGTAYSGMLALNADNFTDAWQFKPNKSIIDTAYYALNAPSIESTPVIADDTLWFGANDGYIYGLNMNTGKVVQKIEISFPVVTPVAIVDKWLYAIDMSGRVFAFYSE